MQFDILPAPFLFIRYLQETRKDRKQYYFLKCTIQVLALIYPLPHLRTS